jgi:cytochrome c oxidase assembly protein subunit 11
MDTLWVCFGYLFLIYILECGKMNKTAAREANKRKLVAKLVLVVVAMFGFGYLLVPLYNVFCSITGLNGKPENTAVSATQAKAVKVDTSRTITIEFLATAHSQLPWEFKSEVHKLDVHPGEIARANFYVRNLENHAVVGQAIPSISPGLAAKHLHKTECFCFSEQILQAGETREMPVVFYIDPELPQNYSNVVLSYTFFNISDKASIQAIHSSE